MTAYTPWRDTETALVFEGTAEKLQEIKDAYPFVPYQFSQNQLIYELEALDFDFLETMGVNGYDVWDNDIWIQEDILSKIDKPCTNFAWQQLENLFRVAHRAQTRCTLYHLWYFKK